MKKNGEVQKQLNQLSHNSTVMTNKGRFSASGLFIIQNTKDY